MTKRRDSEGRPECPHCEHREEDNPTDVLWSGQTYEICCRACGEVYEAEVKVTFSFINEA